MKNIYVEVFRSGLNDFHNTHDLAFGSKEVAPSSSDNKTFYKFFTNKMFYLSFECFSFYLYIFYFFAIQVQFYTVEGEFER